VKFGSRLEHIALPASLFLHLHSEQRLLAVFVVGFDTILAKSSQPISAAPFANEARCFQRPLALPALLLLRRVSFPAAGSTFPHRNAC
jgi:hypothetical protein